MITAGKLAINGGEPTIRPGSVARWPDVDHVDEQFVLASLRQGDHAFGPNCQALEREFAAWNGNRFAITTNSGTGALHMGIAACGVGAGDEVIVTAYSWSSSATCILHHNAIPVFVDIDYATMNIDPAKIEAAITPRTKAIIVVHLHGMAADMRSIMEVARRHGLKVIEDACQAHGAMIDGQKVGTFGDCGAFSLNQNKTFCSGEGGLFVTDDETILANARMIWSFGETRTPMESRDYHAYALGWMYRNNDLTAAFGRAQLTKLDRNLAVQQANGDLLLELLRGVPHLLLPHVPAGYRHTWYNFILRLDDPIVSGHADTFALRDAVIAAFAAEGLDSWIWQRFILPRMTVFQAKNAYGRGCPWQCQHAAPVNYDPEQYPAAERHCQRHLCVISTLRFPNTEETTRLAAQAIWKVMTNLDEVYDSMP